MPVILWFRQDLRLRDNPALQAAVAHGGPIVPVYIRDDEAEARWAPGGASRWWLHHSLASLDADLRARGSRLLFARGPADRVLQGLIESTGAAAVYWNRRYEPHAIAHDRELKACLRGQGVETTSFNSALLFEPHTITNKEGGPFKVFTPYWRTCLARPVDEEIRSSLAALPQPAKWPGGLELGGLDLLPRAGWADGFRAAGSPGEAGARRRLSEFLTHQSGDYENLRDYPRVDGTSRLSAHLHFGEIGPRQIWRAVRERSKDTGVFPANRGLQRFLTELGWREFAYHQLYHFPHTPEQPMRDEFAAFPWASDPQGKKLRAWQEGRTGYPIVDAGMRQLWRTGWMHNRVRMIVASFLVKHLRLPWTLGAAWFWDTLVDADLAANTLNWQWSAGCGADAAPYFRIFAPVLQGEKFDSEGDYVRHWLPELEKLPEKFIHRPWEADADVLARAGIALGGNYPAPIVDHRIARAEALEAFHSLRTGASKLR